MLMKDYSQALHDLYADYPLAPVKTKITYDMLSPYARFLCDRHKLKYMSRCVLEPPVLMADLFVLSPGYEVPPDLATMSPPFSKHVLRFAMPATSLRMFGVTLPAS